MAVVEARGEMGFSSTNQSDIAPLNHLVARMLSESTAIHVMRDPTRGGLATTLNEMARQSHVCIWIDETSIPVRPAVRAACELLGFDPLYVANEGKLIAIVNRDKVDDVLLAMRSSRYGEDSVVIGEIRETPQDRVLMKTGLGSTRILELSPGRCCHEFVSRSRYKLGLAGVTVYLQ